MSVYTFLSSVMNEEGIVFKREHTLVLVVDKKYASHLIAENAIWCFVRKLPIR